ncbi:hypothetical protein EJ04DRAFT_580117 [Polyplosphaeria fusca]|uniref:RING-type domain-containing protein n=1 Tax=Polyplosphaeria fusca TaxID=682080 RepID=A0A9P4QRK3_9PLEO|nr:hypothetical protein EJ04DRAFT_580117 [Polyplosphaeria fusca]
MSAVKNHEVRLETRRDHGYSGRTHLSPATIGFLVPLFVLFLIGPFLCIFCARKRRSRRGLRRFPNANPNPATKTKTPPMRRDEAIKILEEVTETAKEERGQKYACVGVVEEKSDVDTESVLERECAICLSTLQAPARPEPAQIFNSSNPSPETVPCPSHHKAPSIYEETVMKSDEIMRLKVCNHEFHAECLISWCLVRRHTCPICRAVFHHPDITSQSRSQDEQNVAGSAPGGDARSTRREQV